MQSETQLYAAREGLDYFQTNHRYQLEVYVYGLGTPVVFLAFFAADLNWESLVRFTPV